MHRRAWRSSARATSRDQGDLARVTASLTGPPPAETPLQCNLLVIEPDKDDGNIRAWGIRFINPKTFGQHSARKRERVNLLRLYALLVQEKIMRQPESICVRLAELLPRERPRESLDHYPEYFSTLTYWRSEQLWDFIGVPFEVVSVAVREEAKAFRQRLQEGLQALLPPGREIEQQWLFGE